MLARITTLGDLIDRGGPPTVSSRLVKAAIDVVVPQLRAPAVGGPPSARLVSPS